MDKKSGQLKEHAWEGGRWERNAGSRGARLPSASHVARFCSRRKDSKAGTTDVNVYVVQVYAGRKMLFSADGVGDSSRALGKGCSDVVHRRQ